MQVFIGEWYCFTISILWVPTPISTFDQMVHYWIGLGKTSFDSDLVYILVPNIPSLEQQTTKPFKRNILGNVKMLLRRNEIGKKPSQIRREEGYLDLKYGKRRMQGFFPSLYFSILKLLEPNRPQKSQIEMVDRLKFGLLGTFAFCGAIAIRKGRIENMKQGWFSNKMSSCLVEMELKSSALVFFGWVGNPYSSYKEWDFL